MAVVDSEEPHTSPKKRKREALNHQRKLLVDQRVEVRSVEEGFEGSWHSGTVVASDKKRLRRVRYDHILTDDESDKLVEVVRVSPVLDGEEGRQSPRGKIRPLPPSARVRNWDLHYGLCVDAEYLDARWEGVVFDHEDGELERMVFFPDLGDELMMDIDRLRVTREWDEVTGEWRLRGSWVLLESIEELEQECGGFLPVSVKQIWYDVRERREFGKVREWTCGDKEFWKAMVLEVCGFYWEFLAKELCRRLECPGDSVPEAQEELAGCSGVLTVDDSLNDGTGIGRGVIASHVLEPARPDLDAGIAPEAEKHGSKVVVPRDRPLSGKQVTDRVSSIKIVHGCSGKITGELLQQLDMSTGPCAASMQPGEDQLASFGNCNALVVSNSIASNTPHHKEALGIVSQVLPTSQCNHDGTSSGCPGGRVLDGITIKGSDKIIARPEYSVSENTKKWQPISSDVLPSSEFCPTAVDEYLKYSSTMSQRSNSPASMRMDIWKHLLYLGWKIDHSNENGRFRKRYTSPVGKCLYSLTDVCKHLRKSTGDLISIASPDEPRRWNTSSDASQPLQKPQESRSPDCCPQTTMFLASTDGANPDYCSQLVMEYRQGRVKNGYKIIRNLEPKAKEQLVTHGWVLDSRYYEDKDRKITVYKSPTGQLRYSLKAACEVWCAGMQKGATSTCRRTPRIRFTFGSKGNSASNTQSLSTSGHGLQVKSVQPNTLSKTSSGEFLLGLLKVKVTGIRKARRKRDGNLLDFATHMFQPQMNIHARRDGLQHRSVKDGDWNQPKDRNSTRLKVNRGKTLKDARNDMRLTCVLRSSKRVQDLVIPSSAHTNPLSVLSWLIDNGTILPRAKVRCVNRKKKYSLTEGRINCRGIKCSCCSKLFTLSGFAVHAGNNHRKAAANIFLEDGRSILDCEKLTISMRQSRTDESHDRKEINWRQGENDYICSVCHYGGELMLCDQCPASFHKSCLGLKDVPEGDWFCPSCCCRKCRVHKFQKNEEPTEHGSTLTCDQCELKYHSGCLKNRQLAKIKSNPQKNWFCSKICKKIHYRLQKLLGKTTTLDANNLTWSLLKTMKPNSYSTDSEINAVETYSKLNVALSVMHECFKPVKEARTRRDLMEDVIFGRESELQRLNFRGFYTVILARNDELISVATIRIHGKEVAEVPLVGTRFQYRRLGMCRILMKELEKKLMELGVERLVLPAVPSVLNTWTASFGFSEMTASERLHFLDYTFLDFQDTVMCQKLLTNVPSTVLNPLKGMRPGCYRDVCEDRKNTDIDRSSAVSETYQAVRTEDSQIVSRGQPDFSADHKADNGNSTTDIVLAARQTQNLESRPCFGVFETNQDFSANLKNRKDNGNLYSKCYKRRNLPVQA